jgi:hypothetical protein
MQLKKAKQGCCCGFQGEPAQEEEEGDEAGRRAREAVEEAAAEAGLPESDTQRLVQARARPPIQAACIGVVGRASARGRAARSS